MATAVAPAPTTSPADVASRIVPLQAAVQNYAWGLLPDADSLVAQLYASNASAEIDATKPYAELWVGTHPSGPALLQADKHVTLSQFLHRNQLPSIPYLLKVLSVSKPLSIQAHPDKQRARRLHAANPKAYKDDNHKPEMCVALTDFEGMCNFRPVHEILAHLEALPELAALCGGESTLLALADAKETVDKQQALRSLFSNLMTSSEDHIGRALGEILKKLKAETHKSDADNLFLRLVGYYPGDVGCFAAYLLNFVRISPGQAFFMAANEPHAYLKGQCCEIMATSDNVVRAGLTPKFKDVSTLVEMLTYQDGPPTIMNGETVDEYSLLYRPPAEEFQLTKCVMPPGTIHTLPAAKGPGMIMCLGGTGSVAMADTADGGRLPLEAGSIYYVSDNTAVNVQADNSSEPSSDLFFFRAGINES